MANSEQVRDIYDRIKNTPGAQTGGPDFGAFGAALGRLTDKPIDAMINVLGLPKQVPKVDLVKPFTPGSPSVRGQGAEVSTSAPSPASSPASATFQPTSQPGISPDEYNKRLQEIIGSAETANGGNAPLTQPSVFNNGNTGYGATYNPDAVRAKAAAGGTFTGTDLAPDTYNETQDKALTASRAESSKALDQILADNAVMQTRDTLARAQNNGVTYKKVGDWRKGETETWVPVVNEALMKEAAVAGGSLGAEQKAAAETARIDNEKIVKDALANLYGKQAAEKAPDYQTWLSGELEKIMAGHPVQPKFATSASVDQYGNPTRIYDTRTGKWVDEMTAEQKALAAGYTQEQIDAYKKQKGLK